ncbi:MAG: hypothetical protein ABIJ10_02495 [Candidatus Micrarchaeota archaeon]
MKRQNVTFSIGNVALIDKADAQTGFFKAVFEDIGGRAKDFIPQVKLLINNRLGHCLSINRLLEFSHPELLHILDFERSVSERSIYRTIERLGENYPVIIRKYQRWIENQGLVDNEQFADFTSAYFEGVHCPLGKLGYSRDGQPGKQQLTVGISVGQNNIPTMLTIQKGNVQDKSHMKHMIKLCSLVFSENTLLAFDCGGNTRENKQLIRDKNLNYLTLKAKQKTSYLKAIKFFETQKQIKVPVKEKEYLCVKMKSDGENEWQYIFFSSELKKNQLKKKQNKFQKALEKGELLQKKVKRGKDLGQQVCPDGWIITKGQIQKTIDEVKNPFISGIEGFFILESSIDEKPEYILQLYKNRDKAEKFIRALKEGAELRPFRHWSKDAVIGSVLIVFLTNMLINLTLFLNKNSFIKNLKLLKKYSGNLTLSIFYPKNGFRMMVISNYSDEMKALLGDFIRKYGDLELQIW